MARYLEILNSGFYARMAIELFKSIKKKRNPGQPEKLCHIKSKVYEQI